MNPTARIDSGIDGFMKPQVQLPAPPLPGLATFEITAAHEARLQAFFEANPAYFIAVQGVPAEPGEARQEIFDAPPAGWTFSGKWVIGYTNAQGEMVAMATLITDLLAADVWHLGLLIIGSRWQGTGLAQAVYGGLERWALEHGARWMRLGVVLGNARAERFWWRQGFVEVRQRNGVTMGRLTQVVRVLIKPLRGDSLATYLELVARDRPEAGNVA